MMVIELISGLGGDYIAPGLSLRFASFALDLTHHSQRTHHRYNGLLVTSEPPPLPLRLREPLSREPEPSAKLL